MVYIMKMHNLELRMMRRETFRNIDIITLAGSLILVIAAAFLTISIGLQVRQWDDTFRYYNDHMTEWAILQFFVIFLVIQIAGYILKLREAMLIDGSQE
jgi:hypothetical protein